MENKKNYAIPDGVVLEHVCDHPVLAATRELIDRGVTAACILNEAGEYIWHGLEDGKTTEEIISGAVTAFEEDRTDVSAGVEAFLSALVKQGLLIETDHRDSIQ